MPAHARAQCTHTHACTPPAAHCSSPTALAACAGWCGAPPRLGRLSLCAAATAPSNISPLSHRRGSSSRTTTPAAAAAPSNATTAPPAQPQRQFDRSAGGMAQITRKLTAEVLSLEEELRGLFEPGRRMPKVGRGWAAHAGGRAKARTHTFTPVCAVRITHRRLR